MEELLLVVGALARSFLVLHTTRAAYSSPISLLLYVLSRMGATYTSHTTTPTGRLGRGLVLPMQLHCLVLLIRYLVMKTATILIHMRASLGLFASIGLTNTSLIRATISVLNETLISVARSLLDTAFKHVAVLDVLNLFICAAGRVRPTVLRLALRDANIADVTVLVYHVRLLTASFLLRHRWWDYL